MRSQLRNNRAALDAAIGLCCYTKGHERGASEHKR